MTAFKHIQWDGSNLDEVKQFVEDYDVLRHPKYEDVLVIASIAGSLIVDKGDILAFDKDGYLIVLQNENDEDKSESMDDDYRELKETARFFGMSDDDVDRMTGQFERFVSSLKQVTSEERQLPFERMVNQAQKQSEKVSSKAKRHASDFVEKSKNHAKDAYFKSSAAMDEVKRKYQEREQKEEDLFETLRDQEGYSGLSDSELRRIVKSRIFFDRK